MAISGFTTTAAALLAPLAAAPIKAVGKTAEGFADLLKGLTGSQPAAPPAVAGERLAQQRELASEQSKLGEAHRTLPELEFGSQELVNSVSARLREKIAEHGIPTEPAIRLTIDPQSGAPHVIGTGDQREKLEALLAEDPELLNDFKRASAWTELCEAARQSIDFMRAYENDPRAAVEQYSGLFSNVSRPPPTFVIDAFDMQVDV